jgi:hypothetical protein
VNEGKQDFSLVHWEKEGKVKTAPVTGCGISLINGKIHQQT